MPTLRIRKVPAIDLTGADFAVVDVTPKRPQLLCGKAHHRALTANWGCGLDSRAPFDFGARLELREKLLPVQSGSRAIQYSAGMACSCHAPLRVCRETGPDVLG